MLCEKPTKFSTITVTAELDDDGEGEEEQEEEKERRGFYYELTTIDGGILCDAISVLLVLLSHPVIIGGEEFTFFTTTHQQR